MATTEPYKVVLIGESGVGKTCIIAQFTSGKFDPSTVSSLTAQFIRKTLEFPEGKSLTFDIWDTAGQEKYRSLAKIFYKDAKAVVLVYDVTNEKSFNEMKDYWYEQIKQLGDKDIIIAIAANKSDLYEKKQINDEKGEEFSKKIGAIFVPISAKNNTGIQELFSCIGKKILGIKDNYNNNKNNQYLVNENKQLKAELEKYKKENKELKEEIEKIKKDNDKYKEDNDKLNNELLKANKIMSNFNNTQNNLQEYINKINTLNGMIQLKDNIISDLKTQLTNAGNNNKKLYSLDDILVVNFITADGQVNCPIKCLKTDTFAEVEEKLYQKYERYRETNNNFITNGNTILRFKRLSDNKIKDGDTIQMLDV